MKWKFAISGCCVLLLAVNIALIQQNRQLKSQIALPPPMLEAVAAAQMPDLKGFDPEGRPVEVRYGQDSRKVLVLVFSPTCPFCQQNWPTWEKIITSLDHTAVRPVGVDVSSTANDSFVSQHQMAGLPVFVKLDPRARVSYRFQLTPQTILLDPAGKVEKVWTGVLNETAVAELKQRLGGSKTAGVSGKDRVFQ